MSKRRFASLLLILLGVALGFFVYYSQVLPTSSFWSKPFKLGLDLSGGSHLVYDADVSRIASGEVGEAMSALREVIERRVNAFGVGEPLIQIEQSGLGGDAKHRLIVELPGVTDINQAIKTIDLTPSLEFHAVATSTEASSTPTFLFTGLTGQYLNKAQVEFSQNSISPSISISFNSEGAERFARLTRENIGKPLAIFLDGQLLSAPTVREEIRDGRAEISGQFSLQEAKDLARNLNLGALPVPIKLASTQTIGATLGSEAVARGVKAGLIGFVLIIAFMILYYRLPGLIASLSLAFYVVLMLSIFKTLPVTLTAAGIAGFILSIGIAVDANVLIFERLKEELSTDKSLFESVNAGFKRAWLSIRDSNYSTIISSIILFWFGTSLIKGFALTLIIGTLVSLFTAIVVTRTLLLSLGFKNQMGIGRFLFGKGFKF